jgi:hypothetical protein
MKTTSRLGWTWFVLAAACHPGTAAGPGTTCDQQSPCRPPLVCRDGLCTLADAGNVSGSAGSDGGDAANNRDDASSDTAGNDMATAAIDGLNDVDDARPDADADRAEVGREDAPGDLTADASTDAPDQDGPTDGTNTDGNKGVAEPDHLPSLVVVAATDLGDVWFFELPVDSIDSTTPGGTAMMDLTDAAGAVGFAADVEAQATGQIVHVLARVGATIYATSLDNRSWTAWEHVADDVSAMGLANLSGEPWACLVGTDGRLRLAHRQAAGAWQNLGDVMNEASAPTNLGEAPRQLAKVDCAGVGPNLEIMALDQNGQVWDAVKRPAAWSLFARLAIAEGMTFLDVDVNNESGSLDLLATSGTDQYHAIRDVGGMWSGLGKVRTAYDPVQTILAGGQAAFLLEDQWLQLFDTGEIWTTTRFQIGHRPFDLFVDHAPDGHPFRSVAATAVLPF